MNDWKKTLAATKSSLKKYYIFLVILNMGAGILTVGGTALAQGRLLIAISLMLVSTIIYCWLMIVTFQLIDQDKFDFVWQLSFIKRKIGHWLWVSLVVMHDIASVFFPFIYPALKKIGSLFFAPAEALFGQDDNINALKKSAAIAKGKEWHIFLFVLTTNIILPQLAGRVFATRLSPSVGLSLQILIVGLVAPINSIFIIETWRTRALEIQLEPETDPIDYKKLAVKSLPKAIWGFIYFTLLVALFTVLFAVYSNQIPAQ